MHLTALSGYHFVHHLFDSAFALIRFQNKTTDEKVDQVFSHGTLVDSRLSVLEQQFTSFRAKSDLEFAIQQELNDWQENQSSEKFLVLTGLAPAPAKLSGGDFFFYFLFLD